MILIILTAFIVRLIILFTTGGSAHPDEIFQSVEPAHHLAYKYGIMTWEWTDGIRSWFLPGIYAGLMLLAKHAGIDNSLYLVFLVYFFNLLFSLVVVYSMYIIGRNLRSHQVGVMAALLGATFPLITLFAYRPLSEVLSLDCILFALAMMYKNLEKKNILTFCLVGVFLSLSFIIRFASGLFIIPIFIFIIIKFNRQYLLAFTASLILVLLAGGFLDLLTWGSFWHAPIQYFKFNILQQKSANYGVLPYYWYAKLLFNNNDLGQSLVAYPLLLFFIIGAMRGRLIFLLCVLYFICFSLIPHKEARFLLPLFPLSLILIALGIDWIGKTWAMGWAIALALLFLVFTPLSFQKTISNTACQREMFEAMNFVGQQKDAKGLIYSDYWWMSGGYFYLHKNIPIKFLDAKDQWGDLVEYNYAIIDKNHLEDFSKNGWYKIAHFNDTIVYKRALN